MEILNTEEGFNDGSYNYKENTGTKPGSSYLIGIMITTVPLVIDFDRSYQSQDGSYGIHEIGTTFKIAPYLGVSFIDTLG